MLHGADGTVSAIVAIVRDETARWVEERALKAQLANMEAQIGMQIGMQTGAQIAATAAK